MSLASPCPAPPSPAQHCRVQQGSAAVRPVSELHETSLALPSPAPPCRAAPRPALPGLASPCPARPGPAAPSRAAPYLIGGAPFGKDFTSGTESSFTVRRSTTAMSMFFSLRGLAKVSGPDDVRLSGLQVLDLVLLPAAQPSDNLAVGPAEPDLVLRDAADSNRACHCVLLLL